eukprot:m.89023 g.89023  ORF g.89023 m.89023 type:complete len:72 (+) comp12877_c1_seq1:212-427(+)
MFELDTAEMCHGIRGTCSPMSQSDKAREYFEKHLVILCRTLSDEDTGSNLSSIASVLDGEYLGQHKGVGVL